MALWILIKFRTVSNFISRYIKSSELQAVFSIKGCEFLHIILDGKTSCLLCTDRRSRNRSWFEPYIPPVQAYLSAFRRHLPICHCGLPGHPASRAVRVVDARTHVTVARSSDRPTRDPVLLIVHGSMNQRHAVRPCWWTDASRLGPLIMIKHRACTRCVLYVFMHAAARFSVTFRLSRVTVSASLDCRHRSNAHFGLTCNLQPPDSQSRCCRFESRPGLLRTKVYSAFHPFGVGKWVPATAGKAKAGMAHSDCGWTCGCAGKTVKSLRTRAIHERFCGGDSLRRGAIKCMHLYLFYL